MPASQLPFVIFRSLSSWNDSGADDMRYGDLTKNQLKDQFNLRNISLLVDPYTLRRRVFETRYARVLQSIDLLVNGSSKPEYVTRD